MLFSNSAIDATGSTAAPPTSPPLRSWTITLHGSIVPTWSSSSSATWAMAGLQVPSMRQARYSMPNSGRERLPEIISEMTPQPTLRSMAVGRSMASSKLQRRILEK